MRQRATRTDTTTDWAAAMLPRGAEPQAAAAATTHTTPPTLTMREKTSEMANRWLLVPSSTPSAVVKPMTCGRDSGGGLWVGCAVGRHCLTCRQGGRVCGVCAPRSNAVWVVKRQGTHGRQPPSRAGPVTTTAGAPRRQAARQLAHQRGVAGGHASAADEAREVPLALRVEVGEHLGALGEEEAQEGGHKGAIVQQARHAAAARAGGDQQLPHRSLAGLLLQRLLVC